MSCKHVSKADLLVSDVCKVTATMQPNELQACEQSKPACARCLQNDSGQHFAFSGAYDFWPGREVEVSGRYREPYFNVVAEVCSVSAPLLAAQSDSSHAAG